jgi:hypothetical protein
VFVVAAARRDQAARALVARWGGQTARLLTPRDLSRPGWRFDPARPADSTAVVDGQVVPARAIAGVVNRLPWIPPRELGHIVPGDRAYVAAEMTAFLLAWLANLDRPVLGRPGPACLAAPGWGPEQWAFAAARAGLRARPVHQRASPAGEAGRVVHERPCVTVTVVGRRCLAPGPTDRRLRWQARSLADLVGVELVAVHFSAGGADAEFLGADPWPEVVTPEVADAIAAYLGVGTGR